MAANVQISGQQMKETIEGVLGETFKLLDFYWIFLHFLRNVSFLNSTEPVSATTDLFISM